MAQIKGITIEIDANATPLQKALREVDSTIRETQRDLREVDKLLKLDPGNTQLLAQKQKLLGDSIKETKTRLDDLKAAQKKVGEGTAEWNALQDEIVITEGKLESLTTQMKEFGSVGSQKLKVVGQDIKDVGDKIKGAGEAFAPFSAAAGAGIVGAVKEAATFDAQMDKVRAISGASGDEMEILSQKAREMGAATKFSAQEAGEGFEYMAMAGWKTDQMLEGIAPVLNLAAASGEELGTTSDIVTDALTAFGLGAEDAGHFTDVLAAASSNANTNVSMMGESFKYAAPVAGALGYDVEDVAVALGLMANSGIKASQAGTSLRNIFQRMAKPTKESQAAMDRLGVSLQDEGGNMYSFMQIMEQLRESMGNIKMPTEDFMEAANNLDEALENGTITETQYRTQMDELLAQTFNAEEAEKARAAAMLGGARAMAGLLAITNASEEDFNKLSEAVTHSSDTFAMLADGSIVPMNEALTSGQEIIATYNGEAEKMAAIMIDNLPGALTILKSGISELAISIGDALMPHIQNLVAKVQEVVNWFNSLDESQKELIATILVIVAAIAPVLIIIGTLIGAIGNIVTAIGTVMGAFAALNPVVLGIIAVITILIGLGVALKLFWDENREKIMEFCASVQEKWQAFTDYIRSNVEQSMQDIQNAWNTIVITVTEFVTNLANTMTEKWNAIKETISNAITNAKETVTAKASEIKETITTNVDSAVQYLKDLPGKALQWGKDLIGNFVKGIKDKWDDVKETITDIADTVADFLGFSEPEKGPLSRFHEFAPDMMKLYAQGIRDNMYLVTDQMQNLASSMAVAAQRPASIYLTNNTVLNGRVIASAVNEELGFLL